MPSILNPGSATDNASFTGAADGALTLQTGPFGAKINALAFAADGTGTLANTLTGTTINATTQQQGGVAMPRMVQAASVATTSGTTVTISTSIPSWAKRVTVNLNGVGADAANSMLVRIGAGSIQTTGYQSVNVLSNTAGNNLNSSTTGFFVMQGSAAADTVVGSLIINLVSGTTWVASGTGYRLNTAASHVFAGNVTLSGALDRLSIATVAGTANFNAGSCNILYEG